MPEAETPPDARPARSGTPAAAARSRKRHARAGESLEPAPTAPLSLADRAHLALEEMIVKLELEPGSVWSEFDLSERLGIGRTPVREALQQLEREHLVRILPRHGAQITEVSVTQQQLMLEVRRELERLISASAARRSSAEERARLLVMAEELDRIGDIDVLKYLRQHYAIKRFVAACARNPFAATAIAPCHAISRRFFFVHCQRPHDVPTAAKHHADIVRRIALGDEAGARAASDKLMDWLDEFTRATVMRRF